MTGRMELLGRRAQQVRARMRGLRVVVADDPTHLFEQALTHLARPDDDLAYFVHRTLAEPTSAVKKNVIVLKNDEPVLATTLRARQDRWEPATTTVAPSMPLLHRPGFLEPSLAALGVRILIQDYFGDARHDFRRQPLKPFDSYIAQLQGFDYESYWRSTKVWNAIRRSARQTADLEVVHDDVTTLEWSIDTWADRWRADPSDEVGAADDLRAIWPRLLRHGTLLTTALTLTNGTPVATNVNLIDGRTLIGLISARNTTLPTARGSIGTRAELECWDAARRAGLALRDMGGYHEYKRRLTPPGRVAYEVAIEPRLINPDTVARARRIAGRAKRRVQRWVSPRAFP